MISVQDAPQETADAWMSCDSVDAIRVNSVMSGFSGGETIVEAFEEDGNHERQELAGSLQQLLAKQFDHLQKVLTASYDSACSLACSHAAALKQAGADVADLLAENEKLRAQLSAAGLAAYGSETAGTGESTWGSVKNTAQKGTNAAGSAVRNRASKVKSSVTSSDPPLPPPTGAEVSEPTSNSPSMHLPGAAWTAGSDESNTSAKESDSRRVTLMDRLDDPVSMLAGPMSSIGSSRKRQADPVRRDTVLRDQPRDQSAPKIRASRRVQMKKAFEADALPVMPSGQENLHHIEELPSIPLPAQKSTATFSDSKSRTHVQSIIEEQFLPRSNGTTKGVFADAAAMKEKVRQAIGKEEYNVCNMYHETGLAQRIAKSHLFDVVTLSVIALNALWISIDTDYNKKDFLLDYHPVFQVAEHFFCVYFTIEWLIRFLSFKRKKDGMKDSWFVFDSVLVCMMVLETWVTTIIVVATGNGNSGGLGNASILRLLRLLRLTRMARMARLLRAMPELMIMIKGISVAARSVFFTLLLLVLIMYVFAIAFTQLTVDTDISNAYFKTVADSMVTLLLYGTLLEDSPDVVLAIGAESYFLGAIFLFFILLASLTVMNMLVGVLVEVVSIVSAVEKEQLVVNFVRSQIQQMLTMSGIDKNNDQMISKDEFESLLENPKAAHALQEVGVDVVGLVDFTDFIFKDGIELSFPDFMETVLQLRGSNTATVKDIVDMRKFIMLELDSLEESMLTGKTREQLEVERVQSVQSSSSMPIISSSSSHRFMGISAMSGYGPWRSNVKGPAQHSPVGSTVSHVGSVR